MTTSINIEIQQLLKKKTKILLKKIPKILKNLSMLCQQKDPKPHQSHSLKSETHFGCLGNLYISQI
jgi:hypothetical protein